MSGEPSDDIDGPAERKDTVARQEDDPRDDQGIKEEAVAPSNAENEEDCPQGDGIKKEDVSIDMDKDKKKEDVSLVMDKHNVKEGESQGAGAGDCPQEDGIKKDTPDEESPDGGLDANPPIPMDLSLRLDRMVENLVKKSPLRRSPSDGLKKGDEEAGNNYKKEPAIPNKEERSGADVETYPSAVERPEGDLDTNPSVDAEVESAIDRMVEDMVSESPLPDSKLDGNNQYERRDGGSNNGSVTGGEEVKEKGGETSDNESLRHRYPPPPPGYEHYPPPPGYYPYPPHYPPHPHYGYAPPPPGYYPPPPGYYMPPGHPLHPPPPRHPVPSGERDPATGNFIYGGPPPAAAAPAKRSRMRIKTPQDVLNRKIRKNAQSRSRAARLREKVESIKNKVDNAQTEDEARLYNAFEERRARKNNRSRERALEKKAELERITAKPESQRTKEENETLNVAVAAKRRKNEGDRLRRERLKKLGLKVKPPGVRIRGRPRKPLSGEPVAVPYGNPVPVPLVPIPPPPHGGAGAYHYPPPVPPSYLATTNGPPQMKGDDGRERTGHHNQGDVTLGDGPGSAGSTNTEQEVSELLLQDDAGGNDEHIANEGIKEPSKAVVEC